MTGTTVHMVAKGSREAVFCQCGHPGHVLILDCDDEHLYVHVGVSIYDVTLWQRLKMAWRVLTGDEHALAEVVLDRGGILAIKSYLRDLGKFANTETMTTSTTSQLHTLKDLLISDSNNNVYWSVE